MLSDLSLSFADHSNTTNSSTLRPERALISISYKGNHTEELLAIVEHTLPLGILLIIISPEVLRLVECLYFVILRQNRRWIWQNILIFCIIEGIDALLLSFLIFKYASNLTALQFASFGYQTVFSISILKAIGRPRQSGHENVSPIHYRITYIFGAFFHLVGLGTLVWSLVESYYKR